MTRTQSVWVIGRGEKEKFKEDQAPHLEQMETHIFDKAEIFLISVAMLEKRGTTQ